MERINFFQKTSQRIMEKKPLDDLLNDILESSKKLIPSEASTLFLFDRESNSLYFHIATGSSGKKIESEFLQMGRGIAGWVAENRQGVKIDNCYEDKRFDRSYDDKTGFLTKNMMCVPMMIKDDLIGVLQLINRIDKEFYTSQDVEFFNALASECAVAIENARLVDVEVKNEQIKYELATAHNIQKKLLPSRLPEFDDIDIAVDLIPAKEVGGDYYNIFKVNDDLTLFFVCDVSGKSVPAALIAATIYSFAETYFIINKEKFSLVDFVTSLNKFLILSTTPDRFATAWFGLYDHRQNCIESINAGHTVTYHYNSISGKITEMKVGGLFLGCFEMPYTSETVNLQANDLIFFFTDGISEAMNENEEEFGEENIIKLILQNCSLQPKELIKCFLDEIAKFRNKTPQSDDITLGIIKKID
jgi:sigma-B regulation protein RsbU (phosphoserine phosphatase)